jgi:predicted  nucleic acid-binding Zn-ribbon protein
LRIENEIKSLEFELSEMEKKARAIDEKISELELLLPKLKESLENKISKISGKESKILS